MRTRYLSCEKGLPELGVLWYFKLGNDWINISAEITTPVYGYTTYDFIFGINIIYLNIGLDMPVWRSK